MAASPTSHRAIPARSLPDVRVRLAGEGGYRVRITEDGYEGLASFLEQALRTRSRAVILADARVWKLYAEQLLPEIAAVFPDPLVLQVPAGEASKSLERYRKIMDRIVRARIDRSAVLFAAGGGVVGDLAGFVAATYLRGIDFVQLPTTLLSQVDSSVGGKTGINHPLGKNLIGAFHQPRAVYASMKSLTTLPEREYRSGLAEVVKYGIIRDRSLFRRMEQELPKVKARDPELLGWLVSRSVAAKARIVEADERESGERALLNLGHTLGHAIEQSSGYGRWTHGEAVAAGTVAAARVSVAHGWMKTTDADRVESLLEGLDLPTRAPELSLRPVRSAMMRDKKVRSGQLQFVAPRGIGRAELKSLPVEALASELVGAAVT